jgi:23S rRNA (adenine2503-C2)-methyltransferase
MMNFFDKSFDELAEILAGLDGKPFRLGQVLKWVYIHGVDNFEDMTNIPEELRRQLSELLDLDPLELVKETGTTDGTRKFLYRLGDGSLVESVLMPDDGHTTLCLSTQAGCAMGCSFCETATMGLIRNLTRGEILAQVSAAIRQVKKRVALRNLVFMGMGEPLMNMGELIPALEVIMAQRGFDFSPRRVTVSTCGWVPGIEELAGSGTQVNLAVSLNAADDETRSALMPVNRKYPLAGLMKALRDYPLRQRQRVTLEYVLIKGINDRPEDVENLVKLARGVKSKINIIPFNETSSTYAAPSAREVHAFQERLNAKNILATVRKSRGADIGAACGQLAASENSGGTGAAD